MKTVYLAGPINGCSDAEANDWRSLAKSFSGFAFIDPMVRDYRGKEAECVREIVCLDKRDIRESDVVIVMYVKPSVGTAMEVLFAWQLDKPVIVIDQSGAPLSPWLVYHSTCVVKTVSEAMEKASQ
jgi:nucleoside 2-deoxyribosyltransferase